MWHVVLYNTELKVYVEEREGRLKRKESYRIKRERGTDEERQASFMCNATYIRQSAHANL